jgi:hypothetical protein
VGITYIKQNTAAITQQRLPGSISDLEFTFTKQQRGDNLLVSIYYYFFFTYFQSRVGYGHEVRRE